MNQRPTCSAISARARSHGSGNYEGETRVGPFTIISNNSLVEFCCPSPTFRAVDFEVLVCPPPPPSNTSNGRHISSSFELVDETTAWPFWASHDKHQQTRKGVTILCGNRVISLNIKKKLRHCCKTGA